MAKVLIVEDEGIIAMNTMSQLMGMGHEVTSIAKSSETAVARISSKRPDIILMDIVIHGTMDGVELTKLINREYGIPVIYATAHADDTTLTNINTTEHAGVLYKPFQTSQLKEAIEKALTFQP